MEGSLQLFYNYLEEIGCCQICILRYMKGRGNDFLFVKSSLKSVNIKKINSYIFIYFSCFLVGIKVVGR